MACATADSIVPAPRGTGGPVTKAEEEAESLRADGSPLGPPGRHTAFFIGLTGTVGALVALCAGYLVVRAAEVLVLMLIAFFIAVGLHPAVAWLGGKGVPRPLATAGVATGLLLLLAGFFAAAVVPLVDQGDRLAGQLAALSASMHDGQTALGWLNQRFGLEQQVRALVGGGAGAGGHARSSSATRSTRGSARTSWETWWCRW